MDSLDVISARLVVLLSEITGTPPERLTALSTPKNTPGWDSVANLSFIGAVEEEFDLTISTAQALQLETLADMIRLVCSLKAQTAAAG